MVVLSIFSGQFCQETIYICTTDLYEYMKSLRNDVYDLFFNTYMRRKIYREFNHGIMYIVNDGRQVRCRNMIIFNDGKDTNKQKQIYGQNIDSSNQE
jgi:hypothetical protein